MARNCLANSRVNAKVTLFSRALRPSAPGSTPPCPASRTITGLLLACLCGFGVKGSGACVALLAERLAARSLATCAANSLLLALTKSMTRRCGKPDEGGSMKLLATFTGPLASITKRLLSAVNCPKRNFCTNPASLGWSAGHSSDGKSTTTRRGRSSRKMSKSTFDCRSRTMRVRSAVTPRRISFTVAAAASAQVPINSSATGKSALKIVETPFIILVFLLAANDSLHRANHSNFVL